MIALMVGGPVHGQVLTVADPPPWVLMVPREQDWSVGYITAADTMPYEPSPPPHQYDLRRLSPSPYAPWPIQRAYLCMDEPKWLRIRPNPPDEQAIYYAKIAERLWYQAYEASLPGCVAPSCAEKGRYKLTAAEPGRLAGRWWESGDQIRLCPKHGDDVYRAQGAYGLDQLADWLKPDAMSDLIDTIGMSLFAEEITKSRGRAIRIERHGGNR